MFAETPTEQTTAITDLLLSLQAIGAIWMLNKYHVERSVWTDLWLWFFGLLSAARLLGAILGRRGESVNKSGCQSRKRENRWSGTGMGESCGVQRAP